MTNFEKIKKSLNEMDEAAMAEWIDNLLKEPCKFCTEDCRHCDEECELHNRNWLEQEVKEDGKIH